MTTHSDSIDRREAIRRVGVLLGGAAFVGGPKVLGALEGDVHARAALVARAGAGVGLFTAADIAFLDDVADTMLPTTSTPGAKAAKVGAFMALMVTDTYDARDQKIFRAGMGTVEDRAKAAAGTTFEKANPKQRLAVLERLDKEQKAYMDARDAAERKKKGLAPLQGVVVAGEAEGTQDVTAESRPHFFRMMKELACLGYFTSEIGCTVAQRYVETPTRFEPCLPYKKGEKSWAAHA